MHHLYVYHPRSESRRFMTGEVKLRRLHAKKIAKCGCRAEFPSER
jgi:hypothetical protein